MPICNNILRLHTAEVSENCHKYLILSTKIEIYTPLNAAYTMRVKSIIQKSLFENNC